MCRTRERGGILDKREGEYLGQEREGREYVGQERERGRVYRTRDREGEFVGQERGGSVWEKREGNYM